MERAKVQEMTKEDLSIWKIFKDSLRNTVSKNDVKMIEQLHATYFNHRPIKLCTCNPKQVQRFINDLNGLYELNSQNKNKNAKRRKTNKRRAQA